jgi:hypothetical protein
VRRFGWQIGGLLVAAAIVVMLALFAFGCGSAPHPSPPPTATSSPHASPTLDARAAAVEAAARRYVQALQDSAKTGDPSGVDALVVSGSQAEGNAGIGASFSRSNHYNFIATRIDFDETAWDVTVRKDTATVRFRFSLFGHEADWPSLTPRGPDHEKGPVELHLDLELRSGAWLVTESS